MIFCKTSRALSASLCGDVSREGETEISSCATTIDLGKISQAYYDVMKDFCIELDMTLSSNEADSPTRGLVLKATTFNLVFNNNSN